MALLALLCLVCGTRRAYALDPAQPLSQYGQQLWQTDNGLPQNTVHAVQQTRDGFLWLATDGGLVRFDGIEFTLFDRHTAPVLRSNLLGALAETADGALWAATADGLLRRSQGTLRLFGTAEGLPAGLITGAVAAGKDANGTARVWALSPEGVFFGARDRFHPVAGLGAPATNRDGSPIVAAVGDGSLWVAAANQVVLLTAGQIATALPVTADLLVVDRYGILWLATARGLLRYQHGLLTAVAGPNTDGAPAASSSIQALAAGKDAVYVATSGGLGIMSAGSVLWKTQADGMPAGRVLRMYADREGALWISTEAGLVRYAKGRFESLGPRSGGGAIEAIYEDREGDLWLGYDAAGLLELRQQRFTTLTTADGLPGDAVRTLLAGRDGTVWAGTDGDGLAQLHPDGDNQARSVVTTTKQGLSSNTILSLAQQQDGSLAVGTPDGLDRLHNGHAAPDARNESLPDDFIRSLIVDPADQSLWIGTRRGLARQAGAALTQWSHADGLGSDLVGALALDRTRPDTLWIGTRGGLTHLERGHLTNLTVRDGLSSDVITALFEDNAGALWIGTNGGGLNLLRDGHITQFPAAATGLPAVIHSIIGDAMGNLWLAASTGIYRVAIQQLDGFASHSLSHVAVASYGVADGMRIAECSSGHPAAVRTADGALWFATLRGISVTNPEHTQENRLPPPVVIENVTIDDRAAELRDRVTVPAASTRVSLHYAGLSFVAPARVRYRYRLAGFDAGWIDAGTRRVAYYTNIPPGKYTFRVLAANNDGVWNNVGATIELRVLPHPWQTWWFRTLLGLTVLALGYQVYRMRVRSVELRFAAVLGERNRIAREIHDTLAQDIVGISVQLELVSRLMNTSVDAARTQLDAARGLVKSSLGEARRSIWNLRSAAAGVDDLPARLNKAVGQATATAAVTLDFQVRGTYRALPREIEDQLLRVGQEAANNAARHAQAKTLRVTLTYDARAVELTVADDGRGFVHDPAAFAQGGHFGLQGMQERATEIGGILRLESQPGHGTRISLRVDIP